MNYLPLLIKINFFKKEQLLVGLGMPLDLIGWFEEDDRNYEYAPIDQCSRETLNDLVKIKEKAL